jgi:hypothetical protein
MALYDQGAQQCAQSRASTRLRVDFEGFLSIGSVIGDRTRTLRLERAAC